MPKYLVEREIPGVGAWSAEQNRNVVRKSRDVLRQLGPEIQWIQTYVAGDKAYCVYVASSDDLIRRHAAMTGLPANRISEVTTVDPTAAEG